MEIHQFKPNPPSIKGLIRIHKPEQPIRPIVNWHHAPAYKLARLFKDKIYQLAPLLNTFNLKNTKELIQKLEDTPWAPHFKLASLDIKNLYPSIPTKETKTILEGTLKKYYINPQTEQELLNWYDTITQQNYFTNDNNILIQQDGLAMGAPSSSLIAEIFLQHLEHLHLPQLTHKHKIINYWRYADDILITYDPNHTNIQAILQDFNSMHTSLQFTAETETDNSINYLDISIHKSPTGLKISIFRKPTFTDTIIPYTSNHPTQHKYAAIRFLYHRLNTYNLQKQEHDRELNIIHNILYNNAFPIKNQNSHTHNTQEEHPPKTQQKWATFTYTGKETTYITNIFKQTDIKIAFRTNNTLDRLLSIKEPAPDKYVQAYTDSHAKNATKHRWAKPDGASTHAIKNTNKLSKTTATHPTLPSTSMKTHIRLVPCKYLNTTKKGHT